MMKNNKAARKPKLNIVRMGNDLIIFSVDDGPVLTYRGNRISQNESGEISIDGTPIAPDDKRYIGSSTVISRPPTSHIDPRTNRVSVNPVTPIPVPKPTKTRAVIQASGDFKMTNNQIRFTDPQGVDRKYQGNSLTSTPNGDLKINGEILITSNQSEPGIPVRDENSIVEPSDAEVVGPENADPPNIPVANPVINEASFSPLSELSVGPESQFVDSQPPFTPPAQPLSSVSTAGDMLPAGYSPPHQTPPDEKKYHNVAVSTHSLVNSSLSPGSNPSQSPILLDEKKVDLEDAKSSISDTLRIIGSYFKHTTTEFSKTWRSLFSHYVFGYTPSEREAIKKERQAYMDRIQLLAKLEPSIQGKINIYKEHRESDVIKTHKSRGFWAIGRTSAQIEIDQEIDTLKSLDVTEAKKLNSAFEADNKELVSNKRHPNEIIKNIFLGEIDVLNRDYHPIKVPAIPNPLVNMDLTFDSAYSIINAALVKGKKVLLHPDNKADLDPLFLFVAAYLIKRYGLSVNDAINHVTNKCRIVTINPQFKPLLESYAKHIKDQNQADSQTNIIRRLT